MDLNHLNEKTRELQQACVEMVGDIGAMLYIVHRGLEKDIKQKIAETSRSYCLINKREGAPEKTPKTEVMCTIKALFNSDSYSGALNTYPDILFVLNETYEKVEFDPNGLRVYRDGKQIGTGLPEPLFSFMHHEYREMAVDWFLANAPAWLSALHCDINNVVLSYIDQVMGDEARFLFQKAHDLQRTLREVHNQWVLLNHFLMKEGPALRLIAEKIRATKGITKSNTIAGIRHSLEDLIARMPAYKPIVIPEHIKF